MLVRLYINKIKLKKKKENEIKSLDRKQNIKRKKLQKLIS